MPTVVDDDLYDEAVIEFRYQFRCKGWYDSTDDPGWLVDKDDRELAAFVAEIRWHPARKTEVPSRLWDAGLPQVGYR